MIAAYPSIPQQAETLFRVEKLDLRGNKITHLDDVPFVQADAEARRLVEQGDSSMSLVRYGKGGVFITGYQWRDNRAVEL